MSDIDDPEDRSVAHEDGPFAGAMLSPSEIGAVNRGLVLQALWDHGPQSRADLARMGGVTRATIGNIIVDLLDAGLVEEAEPRQTGRVGKPAKPVWFSGRAGSVVTAVLGAGTCTVAVVNTRGEVVASHQSTFDARAIGHGVAADAVVTGVEAVLAERPAGEAPVLGVGIAVPGVCDSATGEVLGSGQVPGLIGTGLRDAVASATGLLTVVDNDARAQALGEKWFGQGRAVGSFASLQTGDGLGLGLVLDGAVFRGDNGHVGEIGHTCVDVDGVLCRCGLRGCWETLATTGWLRGAAGELGLSGAARLTTAELVEAAESDPSAAELLERYADNLAVGIGNIVQMIRPSRIILHGDVAAGGEVMRAALAAAVGARSHTTPGHPPSELVLTTLGDAAGLVGAAGLVWAATFQLDV